MYVEAMINGKTAQASIDMGASHSFNKVEKLGHKVEKTDGWLKNVNSKAKSLNRALRDVKLHLGTWRGKVNFFVVPLDDFTLILGMEFLGQFNVVSLLRCNSNVHHRGSFMMFPNMSKTIPPSYFLQCKLEKVSSGKRRLSLPPFMRSMAGKTSLSWSQYQRQ